MSNTLDLTGQRFGLLTVTRQTGINKRGGAKWLSLCACGHEYETSGNRLLAGMADSCGCKEANLLIGNRFGKLTIIARAENNSQGGRRWLCLCDCGNQKVVRFADLRTGKQKTCGCSKSERMRVMSQTAEHRERTRQMGMRNRGKERPDSRKPDQVKLCEDCNNPIVVEGRDNHRFASVRFCSTDCWYEFLRKAPEHSPNWRGGYNPYYGPNWSEQARRARERDRYICLLCGKKQGKRLHDVHHNVPFREFSSYLEANQLDNLITLCQHCHILVTQGVIDLKSPSNKQRLWCQMFNLTEKVLKHVQPA